MLKYQVTTAPSVEPVSLADMKLHLRVTCTADDDLITALIVAARQWCEDYENRAYITQIITANTFWLPNRIILPKPRLQTDDLVITYVDLAGDTQTLSSDLYDIDIIREPGQVTRAYNATYPSVRGDVNGVTIVYKAGYGAASTDVPQKTIAAIKLMCGHLYENRITVTDLNMMELPLGVKALLNARVKTV
jgi:uncharacterized phiE125 gp8 family phage protein